MLPWGHLAVGYICYSLSVRLRHHLPPEGPAVLALAIGTQFPDLIDKPLAWTFGILPSGRSVGHSLLFALVLGVGLWILARRYDRRTEGIAFLVGDLLHIFVDFLPAARSGQWDRLGALLWPVAPAYQYTGEMDRSIIEFFLALDLTGLSMIGLVLTVIALGLWRFDGTPGVETVYGFVRTKSLDHS